MTEKKTKEQLLKDVQSTIIDAESGLRIISDLEKEGFIVLIPDMITFTNPEYDIRLAYVSIDTVLTQTAKNDPTFLVGNNDLYRIQKSDQFAIHRQKLLEIAQAGGLGFIESIQLDCVRDNNGEILSVKHQVKTLLKHIDGTTKPNTICGEFNVSPINKHIRHQGGKLAESNAYTRAVMAAFPKLKNTYTLEELEKGIIIPVVVKSPQKLMSLLPGHLKEAVQLRYVEHALGLMDTISGTPKAIQPVSGQLQLTDGPTTETEKPFVPTNIPEEPQQNNNHIKALEYKDTTQEARTKIILELAKEKCNGTYKGRTVTQRAIELTDVNKQVEMIETLLNLPIPQQDPNNLPFD